MRMHPRPNITLTAERAKGTRIYTKEFGELIDMESGCWAAVLGHCREEIAEVINENAKLLFHTHQFFDTEHPSALASEISSAAKLKCSYDGTFISSGSDAVSLAVKLSEFLSGKTKKLCFSISSLGSSPELKLPRDPGIWVDLDINECLSCKKSFSCSECGKFNSINYSEISSFVFEPGNSGGLVLCPPEKLIEFLSLKVRRAGGFVIANEVTTGFGRTGKWFGFQHYNIFDSEGNSPDMITLGKGLGNGYPISGVLVKPEISASIEASDFKYVQSHIDDPLGCAVSRKVVEIMLNEQLVEHGNKIGEYLRSKLYDISKCTDGISEIRGRGMMNAFVLSEKYKANEVFLELIKEGFFTGYSETYNLIRLYSPLTMDYDEVDKFIASLKQILQNK